MNRHFGEIGDIWKHLALAEMVAIEKPGAYRESHAGAAVYTLMHSLGRDYGVFYFRNNARQNPILNKSAYFGVLKAMEQGGRLNTYPGSPGIAMRLLGNGSTYHFCDADGVSLVNIRETAASLKISDDRVVTVENDGVPVLASAVLDITPEECSQNLVFIDPFRPLVRSANHMNALDLFAYLTGKGIKAVFWYGYDSQGYREMLFDQLKKSLAEAVIDPLAANIWCGDIRLSAIDDATFDETPGVFGCGIIGANLTEHSLLACDGLGKELEKIYETAKFPDGHSGAIEFGVLVI